MSRLARIVVVAVLTLASITLTTGSVTAGQTDRQRYEAAIKKVALPFLSFPRGKLSKAMCVCNSSDLIGVLETFSFGVGVGVTCTVYNFNADGSAFAGSLCDDWTLITK